MNFITLAKQSFSFLVSDFKFELLNEYEESWGGQLLYLNGLTGVKITYEYREGYIFIMLYKLVEGKLIENPLIIKEDSFLFGYGLDDIITMRNSNDLIKPSYAYDKNQKCHNQEFGLLNYVSDFADNLRKYASNVLLGDFEIFEQLDSVVKERIRHYK